MRCLTKQVALQLCEDIIPEDTIPEPLDKAYKQFSVGGTLPPMLKEYADLFLECARKCGSVYIVLEAYNEHEDPNKDSLLPQLRRFVESDVVKVYVTTRIQFQKLRPLSATRLQIVAPKIDVSNFVRSQLESFDAELREKIVAIVTLNAKGM